MNLLLKTLFAVKKNENKIHSKYHFFQVKYNLILKLCQDIK